MSDKRVFVTVGTTKFDKLIKTVSSKEILDSLKQLGYTKVQFQTGTGLHETVEHESIKLAYSTYFENFDSEILKSDLIISHAGAGSCLQVLRHKKPLIVVINDDLMNNHQIELAEELGKQCFVYYCTCQTLKETLLKDISNLRPYPTSHQNVFASYLNKCMGFV